MVLKMLNINGFHGVAHSPWKVTKLLTIVRNRCLPLSFPQLHRFTHPPDCCRIKSLCTFQQPVHLKMKYTKFSIKYLKKKINIRLHSLKTYQRTEDWLQKTDRINASDKCNKKQLLCQHKLFHPPIINNFVFSLFSCFWTKLLTGK